MTDTAAVRLPGASERLARLVEQRDFLLSSIADLEREHAAGDVARADYEALRQDYVARAAGALREIRELEALIDRARHESVETPARAGSRRRAANLRRFLGRRRVRRVLAGVGAACVVGIVAITAAHFVGIRLPGESATGTITLPSATEVRQDLAQASVLASQGQLTEAIALYDQVLSVVPHQIDALTYRGWLVRLSGIAARDPKVVHLGDAELAEAARIAPGYPDARLLDGIAILQDRHDLAAALEQFRAGLADRPSASLLSALRAPISAAFASAHQPVPTLLRKAS